MTGIHDTMPPVGTLPVDFLCSHFTLDQFDCGNLLLNSGIESRLSDLPDPEEAVLLVAHEGNVIRGYAGVSNLTLTLNHSDTKPSRCFFIFALGVDKRWQGSDLASELVRCCYKLKRRRGRRSRYVATVLTNIYDEKLESRYRRRRFKQVAENQYLWYRLSSS